MRVRDSWESRDFLTVIAKFGVQQTDALHKLHTRGYIYGNISSGDVDCSNDENFPNAYLVLCDETTFRNLLNTRRKLSGAFSCEAITSTLKFAFQSRCLPNGTQDFLRRVPCRTGAFCCDEDDPNNVVDSFQFTYNVQDRKQPR